MATDEGEVRSKNTAWKAFVAGKLIGLEARSILRERAESQQAMPDSQPPLLDDEDRRTLRHAAHLLFPTEFTTGEFDDES